MTVSNQKRGIATRGTMHKPTTCGATDVCFDPSKPPNMAPYQNFIFTNGKLDKGTNSQRTFITDEKIWTNGGAVGKPGGSDSMAVHPPHTMGVATGIPYQKEAYNTSCSGDVMVESRGVVRTDDSTTQNLTNTTGSVDGVKQNPERKPTKEFFEAACKIKKLEGVSTGKEGRSLYKKAPKSVKLDYLHVYEKDVVDFEVERWDTTAKPGTKVSTCQLVPDHAHWIATRTGGSKEKKQKKGTGDKFQVDAGMTNLGFATPTLSVGGEKGGTSTDTSPVTVDWDQIVRYWRAQKAPTEINVRALACGGAQSANLVVKPTGKVGFKLTLSNEPPDGTNNEKKLNNNNSFRALFLAIALCKPPLAVLKAITTVASANITYELKFLDGCTFEVEIEYKRCTEDTTRLGDTFTKAHIRPWWKIAVELNPLIDFTIKGNIAIVDLVQIWAPGAGSAIAKLLKKVKLSLAKVEISLAIVAAVGGEFICDQNNSLSSSQFIYGKITITLSISLRVELSVAEAWMTASVEGSAKLGLGPPRVKDTILQVRFKGKIESKIEIGGKLWWFEAKKTFDGPKFDPPEKVGNIPAPG